MRVAEVDQGVRLVVAVTDVVPQVDCLQVAVVRRSRVAQVLVNETQAVEGVGLTFSMADGPVQRERLLAQREGVLGVSEVGLEPVRRR